jgi:hypothetical protein
LLFSSLNSTHARGHSVQSSAAQRMRDSFLFSNPRYQSDAQ